MKHQFELAFLSQFADVEDFAMRLLPERNFDVSPTHSLMMLIGHVLHGFTWYLDDLLDKMKPSQLIGVIAHENFSEDFHSLFGFYPAKKLNAHHNSRGSRISNIGRDNLSNVLASEYKTLSRLEALGKSAGIRLSTSYDRFNGASQL